MATVYRDMECTVKAECPLKSAGYFANCSSDFEYCPYCDTLCAWCDTEGFIDTGVEGVRMCRCFVASPRTHANYYMED